MRPCDYCDEGLPFDGEGWHLRVDPEGYEQTQRMPCARLEADAICQPFSHLHVFRRPGGHCVCGDKAWPK